MDDHLDTLPLDIARHVVLRCAAGQGDGGKGKEKGIIGIAAPIRDFSREVVAALGVALPMSQSSEKEVRRMVRLLKTSTDEISTNLGYLKI
ncbi:MAG: hypothetical protein JRJ09_08960 [Deltaproteobacteria bacterium]|nr:hypothetical protein [Deltaproteobacteria bacterium]MBW2048641.1 hypothetical protein [Deltaproteobacteria bacterium]MBW2111596.1 hypothetical protein [Deltaproteobacteria bacterium]MBW2353750.1 hypothetical protein [Deltaproteobacteria bacterium]